jgi:hypothetical protein
MYLGLLDNLLVKFIGLRETNYCNTYKKDMHVRNIVLCRVNKQSLDSLQSNQQ